MVHTKTEGLKYSFINVTNEELVLSREVQNILEQKRAKMLSSLEDFRKTSKNSKEMKLYEMNYKVV